MATQTDNSVVEKEENDTVEQPIGFTIHRDHNEEIMISMLYIPEQEQESRYHMKSYTNRGEKILHKLRTITDVDFIYPIIMFIRGGNECYLYNTIYKQLVVLKLSAPVISTSRSINVNGEGTFQFDLLIDCGEHF